MDLKYIKPDESEEFHTEERCHILELLNDHSDRSHSLARARVEPETTTAWHRLKGTSETYYILKGTGVVELGEDFRQEVSSGDTITIPPDTPQRISNNGIEDLVFLCFCMPAFGPECYEDLE